ncbi:hypothetical protein JXO59_12380 [candidate division KSB1 bacterium]|nr:hypothetical protein [candidate division KSB1 bacterium]
MNITLKWWPLLFVVPLWLACREQATSPPPVVPPPQFVSSSEDTAALERGIDAIPEMDAIFLQWYKNSLYESFQLWRRAQGESLFRMIASLPKSDSSYIDLVDIEKRYYYYLLAVDAEDNWSEPSDTAHYLLLPKATDLNVVFSTPLQFIWQKKGINPPHYILRLYDDLSDDLIWLSRVASAYQGDEETTTFNWDGNSKLSQLLSGRRYRWRIDCLDNTPYTGSESLWHRFVMP